MEDHKLENHTAENHVDDAKSQSEKQSVKKKNQAPLIVVSNRLPFVLQRTPDGLLKRKPSAGGLVTAVAPVVIDCQGKWVGWTGLHDFNENIDVIPESDPDDKAPTAGLRSNQALPVSVEHEEFDQYYNGCCNETFWPLFHSMPDRAVFNKDHWKAYTSVNEMFAKKTLEAIRKLNTERLATPEEIRSDPTIVWLHDYHLMLAANTIRDKCDEEKIEIRMGFFLHIPFPTYDIIRIFPWVDEILMGMLGCDLIGFHIDDYCLNFLDCCQKGLGSRASTSGMWVEHLGRVIKIKTLPIGIPYSRFETLAQKAPSDPVYDPKFKVILGVDRLDYTKGLVARMNALERLFIKYPKWIGKVIFFQVAVPSRTDVKEYKELKETLDKLIGRINGKYSTLNWSPIRYIYGSRSQENLAAFYRDADVALVTPLRDGMNLVAKEFVACQDEANPGVLILSPFAGAGILMHEALQANPYETDNVAEVLNRALEMSLDERQLRMNQLKKRERRMDVDSWVRGFLTGMDELHVKISDLGHFDENHHQDDMNELEARLGPYVEMSTKLGIIIDFDGTLSCLARTPEMAILAPETKKILERMAKMPDVHVAIISGRQLDNLKRKVNVEGITYAGNHGLVIMHPDGQRYYQNVPQDYKDRLSLVHEELKATVERDGAWVEDKDLLVSWHFREVSNEKRDELMAQAKAIYEKYKFETFVVSKRLENLPPDGWDRGQSSFHILRSIFGVDWEERVKVIYAGDSAADEVAIKRLKGVAYTFRVNNIDSTVITKTSADYRLQGTDGVHNLLKFLERKLLGRSRKPSSQSHLSRSTSERDLVFENVIQETESPTESPVLMRRRTSSYGSSGYARRPSNPTTSSSTTLNPNLCKQTLSRRLHSKLSD